MKNTGPHGNVYDFSIDYKPIAVDDILDIYKYLMEKKQYKMMLGLIKKCFFHGNNFFSYNLFNVNSLECVSMSNQEFKIRSEKINVNTNEPMFYTYSIAISKSKGSCNTINDTYTKLCVPDTIKNINIKVFNLMSRTNGTRYIEWHKTCKYRCRLDASVCSIKQRWNEDKCRFECKELIDR